MIEFNRNFDRLGDGKLTSLPNKETTLLQLASLTDQELEATLRIVIVRSVVNASVTCANDVPESKQQILLLAGNFSDDYSIKQPYPCMHVDHLLKVLACIQMLGFNDLVIRPNIVILSSNFVCLQRHQKHLCW